MSKDKKAAPSPHAFKSYLNPLVKSQSQRQEKSKAALPMHLCHSSSVQCDVLDVLKENVIKSSSSLRKCKSQRETTQKPLALRGPLSASKKQNAKPKIELFDSGELSASEAPLFCATPNHRLYLWDEQGCSEASPASSWSTLGNRALLLRPLPLDVGRCTCYIVREQRDGPQKPSLYALYTDEGVGRQDRLLAVARHRRRIGRSEFVIAQSSFGNFIQHPDEGFIGTLTSNLVGTRYQIWDQAYPLSTQQRETKMLIGVVAFEPTVTTLMGDSRKMRAFLPKYGSMQMSGSGLQNCCTTGLRKDWEENMGQVDELVSVTPCYNKVTKRYELTFCQEKSRMGCRIRSSVKNFQLTMEENGKQEILVFGKISKHAYVMDYCFPLNAYQAFSICLASIDSKLCCTV